MTREEKKKRIIEILLESMSRLSGDEELAEYAEEILALDDWVTINDIELSEDYFYYVFIGNQVKKVIYNEIDNTLESMYNSDKWYPRSSVKYIMIASLPTPPKGE